MATTTATEVTPSITSMVVTIAIMAATGDATDSGTQPAAIRLIRLLEQG